MLLMIPSDVIADGTETKQPFGCFVSVRPVPANMHLIDDKTHRICLPELSMGAAKAGFPGTTASSFVVWSPNVGTFTSPRDPLPRSTWGLDVVMAWQRAFTAITH